jgi:hypothetical protein
VTVAVWVSFRYYVRSRLYRKDQIQETYHVFCRKLAGIGIQKHPAQGPLDFAKMINMHRPELKNRVAIIMDAYIALRYRRAQANTSLRVFKQLVRRFDASPN